MAGPLGAAAVVLAAAGLWQVGEGLWIHAKAELAQRLLTRAWAASRPGGPPVRPWPWADTWPVARLRVPAHGVDLVVLSGVSGRTLAFGPGHAPATASPGARGTTILTGHRDTHFRFLQRLAPGERVLLEAPGQAPVAYVVRESTVVDARRAAIRMARDRPRLVLLTCYPFDAVRPGGPLRYAVLAEAAPVAGPGGL
jgi:sortase A